MASGSTIDPPINTSAPIDNVCATIAPEVPYLRFHVAILVPSITLDTVLLIAIILKWNVLKRNHVHAYIFSCLLSVLLFNIISVCEIYGNVKELAGNNVVGGLRQSYNSSDPTHNYVFRNEMWLKGLILSLSLVMEFNIAALVYGIGDGTIFVGRRGVAAFTGQGTGTLQRIQQKSQSGKYRKLKSIIVIATVWTVPMIISLPNLFEWNCIEHCNCLPLFREKPYCEAPSATGMVCSRIWPPMTKSYIILSNTIYVITLAIMIAILISTIVKYYKAHAPRMEKQDTNLEVRGCNNRPDPGDRDNECRLEPADGEIDTQKSANNKASNVNESRSRPTTERTFAKAGRPHLGQNFKLIIGLTASLCVFMSPMELMLLLDVVIKSEQNATVVLILLAMSYVYAASVPVLLLAYMGSLRTACIDMLLKWRCIRSTVTTKEEIFSIPAKGNDDEIKKRIARDPQTDKTNNAANGANLEAII